MYYTNSGRNMFILPGRLRIHIKGLYGNREYAQRINQTLLGIKGIIKVSANHYTENVLIYYKEEFINISSIERLIYDARLKNESAGSEVAQNLTCLTITKGNTGIKKSRLGLAACGGLLTYFGVKRYLPMKAFSKSNSILPAAIALFIGYPILKKGLQLFKRTKRVNYRLIFGLVLLCSIAAGDSVFGFLAILTAYATEYAEHLVSRRLAVNTYDDNWAYEQLEIDKNIKNVYSKLIPIAFAVSSIFFIVSGNFQVPLAIMVLMYPYMVFQSKLITLKSAAANACLNGIILNSPLKLELAGKVDTVAFDNTNLLTAGKCRVSSIIPAGINSENRVLMLAASCGKKCEDPIAKALVQETENRKLELKHASNTKICIEHGISCKIDRKEVIVGNKKQFRERKLSIGNQLLDERRLLHSGQYPIFVAYDHRIIGVIGFLFDINKACIQAIEAVRETGIENIKIISEESEEMVKNIAFKVGIESYDANLMPESKIEKIDELKEEGRTIALVLGGYNDYPDQKADISITVLNTDKARICKYSDFVITNGDLRLIPKIIGLGQYTGEVLLQNYVISLGLDAIGIVLVLTSSITPYSALLYKFLNSFIVLMNARKPLMYNLNNWESE